MKRILKIGFVFTLLVFSLFIIACSQDESAADNEALISPEAGEVAIQTQRKIIYNVTLKIDTSNIDNSLKKYNSKISELGGYISSSTVSFQTGEVVYKVPSENLNKFLSFSSEDSEVVEKIVKSNDVTSTYNKITARLEVLNASRKAYVAALEEASSLVQIMELNDKIAEIDTEIITLENEKASYDSIIDFSTITIYFNATEEESFFKGYWNYIVVFFTGLGKFILYALPIALVGGVVIVGLVYFDKLNKKRRKKE